MVAVIFSPPVRLVRRSQGKTDANIPEAYFAGLFCNGPAHYGSRFAKPCARLSKIHLAPQFRPQDRVKRARDLHWRRAGKSQSLQITPMFLRPVLQSRVGFRARNRDRAYSDSLSLHEPGSMVSGPLRRPTILLNWAVVN